MEKDVLTEELLSKIYKETTNNKVIVEVLSKIDSDNELFKLHIGLGTYLRNTYLWNNDTNIQLLKKYFKAEDVDDISQCIMAEIYKKINKKKSKPFIDFDK